MLVSDWVIFTDATLPSAEVPAPADAEEPAGPDTEEQES